MKYIILKAIKHYPYIDYERFVKSISARKRNIPLLKESCFDIRILATAAPSCYSRIIARNESFDVCLGTEFPNANFNNEFENSKEIKKRNVMHHLKNINIDKIDTLITDHIDDLPLMKIARRNIIVRPNFNTKTELKRHNISFDVLS